MLMHAPHARLRDLKYSLYAFHGFHSPIPRHAYIDPNLQRLPCLFAEPAPLVQERVRPHSSPCLLHLSQNHSSERSSTCHASTHRARAQPASGPKAVALLSYAGTLTSGDPIPGWVFHQNLDSFGGDLYPHPVGHGVLEAVAAMASAHDRIVAFNSDGWVKEVVKPRAEWIRWKPGHPGAGMYVRESNVNAAAAEANAAEEIRKRDLEIAALKARVERLEQALRVRTCAHGSAVVRGLVFNCLCAECLACTIDAAATQLRLPAARHQNTG